jgi:hypothetical protein
MSITRYTEKRVNQNLITETDPLFMARLSERGMYLGKPELVNRGSDKLGSTSLKELNLLPARAFCIAS